MLLLFTVAVSKISSSSESSRCTFDLRVIRAVSLSDIKSLLFEICLDKGAIGGHRLLLDCLSSINLLFSARVSNSGTRRDSALGNGLWWWGDFGRRLLVIDFSALTMLSGWICVDSGFGSSWGAGTGTGSIFGDVADAFITVSGAGGSAVSCDAGVAPA